MAEPPSYEESTFGVGKVTDHKGDSKTHQQWSIREQVGLSRTQHVASIVLQIVEHIKERATQGLSKTILLFIPSDQGKSMNFTQGKGGHILTQLRCKSKGHNRRLSRRRSASDDTVRRPAKQYAILAAGRSSVGAESAATVRDHGWRSYRVDASIS
jgi:hypothetical protein